MAAGLYLHIPFCKVKCKFCHFATFPGLKKRVPAYLSALKAELALAGGGRLDTVFFGGGTPTFLSAKGLAGLLRSVRDHFKVASAAEVSIECNPDDGASPKL